MRPFNQREEDLNCRLCVEMVGNLTRLFDADDPEHGKQRDYTFDYSFWSHDGFEVDERGYFKYPCSHPERRPRSTRTSGTCSSR